MVPGIDRQPLEEASIPIRMNCCGCWSAGGLRGGEDGAGRLNGDRPGAMRRDVLGFGWLGGYRLVASKCTSSIRRAWRYRASTVGQRPTGWTLPCSSACFLAGYAANAVHCGMVAIPTIEERGRCKRPSRERESLVGERTRIINRMEVDAGSVFGIRVASKPQLRKAPQRLRSVVHAGGQRDPGEHPSTRSAATWPGSRWSGDRSRRSSGKRGWNVWKRRRQRGRMRWCACWRASSASASRAADMLVREVCCLGNCATDGPWRAYAGLDGIARTRSGSIRREKGVGQCPGNAFGCAVDRSRRLAWRFLSDSKSDSVHGRDGSRSAGPRWSEGCAQD